MKKQVLKQTPKTKNHSLSAALILLIFLSSSFTGCAIVVPFINGFKELGVTKGDRQAALSKRLKSFNNARQFGRMQTAALFVKQENRSEVVKYLRQDRGDVKIVKTEVEFVNYNDRVTEADAEVLVRYYKAPYYIVKDRLEIQTWVYAMRGGWKVSAMKSQGEK